MLEKKPFVNYTLEENKDTRYKIMTLRLTAQEYEDLKKDKALLNQAKDGSAIKTLVKIGRAVLHDQKTGVIIRELQANKRRNERTGHAEFE